MQNGFGKQPLSTKETAAQFGIGTDKRGSLANVTCVPGPGKYQVMPPPFQPGSKDPRRVSDAQPTRIVVRAQQQWHAACKPHPVMPG